MKNPNHDREWTDYLPQAPRSNIITLYAMGQHMRSRGTRTRSPQQILNQVAVGIDRRERICG